MKPTSKSAIFDNVSAIAFYFIHKAKNKSKGRRVLATMITVPIALILMPLALIGMIQMGYNDI